ncbi:unnamed protein product [Caenorhabditis sp. 36 PRJEB53466]|nr:unnamed protein product [Caenorhabditis sp. 36 PRJEB53466]
MKLALWILMCTLLLQVFMIDGAIFRRSNNRTFPESERKKKVVKRAFDRFDHGGHFYFGARRSSPFDDSHGFDVDHYRYFSYENLLFDSH